MEVGVQVSVSVVPLIMCSREDGPSHSCSVVPSASTIPHRPLVSATVTQRSGRCCTERCSLSSYPASWASPTYRPARKCSAV